MTTPSHRDRALNHLAAAQTSNDLLADLYRSGETVDRRHIAELHEQVRLGVKLAQVQALLAIGEQLEVLTIPAVVAHPQYADALDRIVSGQA